MSALAPLYGEVPNLNHTSPDHLKAQIRELMTRTPPDGKRLLVVIDALDEAVGWKVDSTLIPSKLPEGIKVVVSARQIADRTLEGWYQQLKWSPAQVQSLTLDKLDRKALLDVIKNMGNPLAQMAVTADNQYDELLTQIERISEGDTLTIHTIVGLLEDGELKPESLHDITQSLKGVMEFWLQNIRKTVKENRNVKPLLRLCAAALGPLNLDDILSLCPDSFSDGDDIRSDIEPLQRFIIGDGTVENGYIFSHPRLREIYFDGLAISEKEELLDAFVDYGKRCLEERSQSLPQYVRHYWIYHLEQAQRWLLMQNVLVDFEESKDGSLVQQWVEICYREEGSHTEYLTHLDVLWNRASEQNDLGLFFRCALICSSLRSLSASLSPELLVGLVTVGTPEGKWSEAAALEHIRQMPNSAKKSECIKSLVKAECYLPSKLLFDVVEELQDEWERTDVLKALAPYHPEQVLVLVQDIKDTQKRVEILVALAQHLPEKVLALAQDIHDTKEKVEILKALARHFPEQVLALAQDIHNTKKRVEILKALAPHLSEQVLVLAQDIRGTKKRVEILVALARYLPRQVLELAQKFKGKRWRAVVLTAVVPHLSSPEEQKVLWQQILVLAQNIKSIRNRIGVLSAVAPHLSSQSVLWRLGQSPTAEGH